MKVSGSGQIYIAGVGAIRLSSALADQLVGIREESDGSWLVSYATLDLGHVRPGCRAVTPISREVSQ